MQRPSKPPLVSRAADFHPEDGGHSFLRNIGSYTDYTALHPNIQAAIFFPFLFCIGA
jgi:hypothetical protein